MSVQLYLENFLRLAQKRTFLFEFFRDLAQKRTFISLVEATTPAWTSLFATASAVVTELGGVLSHAAVVARIPLARRCRSALGDDNAP
jgi:hypothetical protein